MTEDQIFEILNSFGSLFSQIVIHAILLVFMIIGMIVSGGFLLYFGKFYRAIFCFLLALSLIIWFVVAVSQPLVSNSEDYYEIKMVTWPDGTTSQMWTADNVHHSVTANFNKIVDIDKWHVKQVTWKHTYKNISFYGVNPKTQNPTFSLVEKNVKN